MVQNKDYYITNMTYYVDVNVDITKLPNYAKSNKQTSAILRGSILGMVEKNWHLEKLADLTLYFDLTNLEEINTSKILNFFDIENKKTKNVHIYSAYLKLQDRGLKFLTNDRNSLIKIYSVKISDDLKFLTRFLNDMMKVLWINT